ncbi:MAG: SAM-dependent methyltransferase [Saprospiraceae bacterium]|nr:SAM-dependent methyltransferase [Saprospiraceae bacterium]
MKIEITPIGYVKNSRAKIEDDNWSEVLSEIVLNETIIPESLNGIEEFSHLEIIFYMDQVLDEKAIPQYRHPRNNLQLPKLGTFAQRNKNRPNKLGLTTVELIERNGRILRVKNLDAIHGTPVLDIKPVMKEFQPQNEIRQPEWTREIMKNYWKK